MSALADERGETLMELMVTIVIMAIGVTAVVSALYTTVVGSDAHHSLSQGEVLARDYGEAIKAQAIDATGYSVCPGASTLKPATFDFAQAGSGGWDAAIQQVDYSAEAPSGKFTWITQSSCTQSHTDCLNAGGSDPGCVPGLLRVTYHVFNSRTDVGKADVGARVLIRRNNATTAAP